MPLQSALPWPLPERTDLRDALLTAYSTDRGYHDLVHLSEVLERVAELGEIDNVEVVLAAWYHDAVYDDAGDNEERSAQLAIADLSSVDDVDADEVARLVRLTVSHSPTTGDRNGETLCDADLGILAAPRDRYDEYVAGVRREYSTVSDRDFAAGRLAILQRLDAKESLFHSELARAHWEPAARTNLAREMSELARML